MPSFLQAPFWGTFKARFGWKPLWVRGTLVLTRRIARLFTIAYIPRGPEIAVESDKTAALAALVAEVRRVCRPLFIRVDPPWNTCGAGTPPPRLDVPFVRAGADIQPPDTVIVDLSQSEDEILAAMHSKTRYNCRLGGKKVAIEKGGASLVSVFYALFEETARRDGLAIHPMSYYQTLFDVYNNIVCYVARFGTTPVASIIVLSYGDTATYLYGASSNEHRNLMAPYALQWQAMRDAKASGCLRYDLFGIPPDGNPAHPMHGLYQFKTGFAAADPSAIVHYPGSWDYPCNKILYALYRAAEKIRKARLGRRKKAR